MTRLRFALLVLAAVIALLVTALVSRALDSAEAERRMRHQAVAHRAFDEMERVLSAWLEREESRPFGDYRFYPVVGEDGGAARSALSFPSGVAFVIGAFQIDPDGSLHTPLEPRDPDAAADRGDWPPAEDVRTRIERVRALAAALPEHARRLRVVPAPAPPGVVQGEALRSLGYTIDALEEDQSASTAPGRAPDARQAKDLAASPQEDVARTRPPSPADISKESEEGDVQADDPEQAYSAYQALEKLNFASNQRTDRRQKVQLEKRSVLPPAPSAPALEPTGALAEAESVGAEAAAENEFETESENKARTKAEAKSSAARGEAPLRVFADGGARDADLSRRPAAPAAAGDAPAAQTAPALEAATQEETVRIAIDPMTGVPLPTPEPMLALYRSVIVDAQGYRQGLIVDLEALGAMLEDDVVRAGGLGEVARVRFAMAGAAPLTPAPGYTFEHRFAEPFDALSVRLDLRPLDGDENERRTLLALAGLVLLLTFGGLFVVDRTIRVVMDYAERRSNFVSAVSHELKTPLTSIRMYAEMLRDGVASSEAKRSEYLGTISDESERLTRLIDNVLEFSRLEQGRAELALAAGDVARPVREAVRQLGPFAERAGFTLRIEVEPDLPPVLFERDALLQVVFNLVDNAIKYAASATRRDIIVRVARSSGERCEGGGSADGVEISVRDFGPGVPRAALRRVFEPFHRGESELTRSSKGTGIGLALVAELAAAMRARVVGESPDGGGFMVRLTLAAP